MIYILSWTTKKHQKILSRLLHSKLKKIQALFKDLHRNLRTFQGKMEFKDFSRTSPKIQGLFKTVRALGSISCFSCSGILYKTRTTFSFPFRQTSAIYVYPSISCLPVLACFFGRSRCFKCCVSFFIV